MKNVIATLIIDNGVLIFKYMKKYTLPFTLFFLGIVVTIFAMLSTGNIDGMFSKILNLFSIQRTAHLAWMQLTINFGMFLVHISFFSALVISINSVLNHSSRIDKWILGFSALFVSGILFLWIIDGSYPVLYNTWELIAN